MRAALPIGLDPFLVLCRDLLRGPLQQEQHTPRRVFLDAQLSLDVISPTARLDRPRRVPASAVRAAAARASDDKLLAQLAPVVNRVARSLPRDEQGGFEVIALKARLTDPKTKGDEAVAVAFLLSSIEAVLPQAKPNDVPSTPPGYPPHLRALLVSFAHKQRDGFSTALFEGKPDPDSVRQGFVSDCYLLAGPLKGLARRRPADLRRMVREIAPGGPYEVTFAGGKRFRVPAPTNGEALYFAARADGRWAYAVQKAYGMFRIEQGTKQGSAWAAQPRASSTSQGAKRDTSKIFARWTSM